MANLHSLKLLENVRFLLRDKACWTQGALARNSRGERCNPFSTEAQSWCLMGALQHLSNIDFKELSPAYYDLKSSLPKSFPEFWAENNDKWNHKEMLNYLDQQINRLRNPKK